MQGAAVSFGTEHGDVAVTGNYAATVNYFVSPDAGDTGNNPRTETTNGTYTATLVWNGQQLQLLKIAKS